VRLSRRLAFGFVSFTALLLVTAATRTSSSRNLSAHGASADAERREIARIRAHFDSGLA
jgi:hypothetical protein